MLSTDQMRLQDVEMQRKLDSVHFQIMFIRFIISKNNRSRFDFPGLWNNHSQDTVPKSQPQQPVIINSHFKFV